MGGVSGAVFLYQREGMQRGTESPRWTTGKGESKRVLRGTCQDCLIDGREGEGLVAVGDLSQSVWSLSLSFSHFPPHDPQMNFN